uniref:Uncharacterized protein n=1 Tax=Arundo donax TaxID=35708 RepID=A0A0A9BLF0_ARUDO
MLVDQIMDSVAWFKMIRLPSLDIFSRVWLRLVSVIGSSLLATHTVVKTGILLNHMPRYQPGEVVVLMSVYLLMMPEPGLKKPSAKLPFLETSLSSTASAWPTMRVSAFAAAEHEAGVCRDEKRRRRRNPPSNMFRGGMAGEEKN